ncbi:MAG: hypothetical protein IK079_00620, partial [Desulfovibrio sp.]|nr:hypothetical protein [Desulfovibrio sp.]
TLALEELLGVPLPGTLQATITAEEITTRILQVLKEGESGENIQLNDFAAKHGVSTDGQAFEIAKDVVEKQ